MDKQTLISITGELYHGAFDANAYYLILQQYQKNLHDYAEEMKLSPAFYHTVYGALVKSCFMEVAKLFDCSKNAVSIGSLLKECLENQNFFPEYRETMTVEYDKRMFSFQIPYQHNLRPQEECFFKEQVERERKLFAAFNSPDADKIPIQVDLTFSEFLELYQKCFMALSKKREKIRIQRNKIYAHNDVKRISRDERLTAHSISFTDMQEMIDFSLDCLGLILEILTDVNHVRKYANISDWENTLMMTRLGMKYQDFDLRQVKNL